MNTSVICLKLVDVQIPGRHQPALNERLWINQFGFVTGLLHGLLYLLGRYTIRLYRQHFIGAGRIDLPMLGTNCFV